MQTTLLDMVPESAEASLFLKLGSFEGPIDLLLELCRQQKVDLKEISVLALAEQYIEFISTAQGLDLEIAADYLVMAAWLAYLKSRLLLPKDEIREEEPSAEAMAEWLAFQLQRLQAMRDWAENLFARPQMGQHFFKRGYSLEPQKAEPIPGEITYEVGLYDLLKAYGDMFGRKQGQHLVIEATDYFSMEEAVERLKSWVGKLPDWQELLNFLPENMKNKALVRSAVASTFAACLELAKQHSISLRQLQPFGPIYIKSEG